MISQSSQDEQSKNARTPIYAPRPVRPHPDESEPVGFPGLRALQGVRRDQLGALQAAPVAVPGERGRVGDPDVPADGGGAGPGAGPGDAGVAAARGGPDPRDLQGGHDVRAPPDQGAHRAEHVRHHGAAGAARRGPDAGGQELQGGVRAPAVLVLLRDALVCVQAYNYNNKI